MTLRPDGTRSFRTKVRGQFTHLTPEQREALLARSEEHDTFRAAFTGDGTLTYDLAARPFFTFRFADCGDTEEDAAAAAARAQELARQWLDARGLTYRIVGVTTEDLSQAPLGKRQRRASSRAAR